LLVTILLLEKLSSIEDPGQTDRATTPTRAGLGRWRWPQPYLAARLVYNPNPNSRP